ncbi:Outer membrane usher protein FimD precursor [compost metagenome]
MAAGKVRDIGDSGADEPQVFTINYDWLVGKQSKIAAGAMLTGDYTAAGLVLDTVFTKDTSLSFSNVISQAKEEDKNGLQSSITARTKLTERVSASGSVTQQSTGYRSLLDTTQVDEQYPIYQDPTDPDYLKTSTYDNDDDRSRTEYSANLGFSTEHFGGGSLGFVQSKSAGGDWSSSVSASWGKSFKGTSISATLQHDLTGNVGDSAFLSVSVPLGQSRSIQTRVSKSGNSDAQIGVTYTDRVNDALNYSISATKQGGGDGTNMAGNVSATPRYAQVNLGYSQDGADSTNYSTNVRGAFAFHGEGVTPSPYHIQDTFGIAKVGDEAGIKINTPNGNVWTDAGGRAVLAQIPAYSSSRVEVATDTLPRNVDIDNGYKSLNVGRGSVSLVEFGVVKVRRLLLTAVDQHGSPLPKGASVTGQDDAFVTTVIDDGKIFLEDTSQTVLMVNLPGGKQCALEFELAEEADIESYFEHASAVCPIR